MKMSIKPLNIETVKLINSTQVISSIYSAIKELVENSLDAQAHNIEVNLVDNGLTLIEVKDNGIGVSREDAKYMALPSYTSKISDFNDLDLLSTYGFRGEGLSSICQVSDVRICTKTANDETMICYTLDHEGNIITSDLSHGLTGTTVQMKNLFKNMPVRRNIFNNKKKINQEIKITEILLKTYAICKPTIRFLFRVNGNTVFTKSACKDITEAIKSVLGIQIFSKLAVLQKNTPQAEIELFVPKKDIKDCTEVCQTGFQFICVNDRPIKSKEIEKKINKRISDYFNQSSTRKFIFCIVLKVDPSVLDVNLEPNKDKVFLQNEALVLSEIDNSLLSFYELQDSQLSVQTNVENIDTNKNTHELEIEDKQNEWPACKKRRLSDNVCDISGVITKGSNSRKSKDQQKKKSDSDFFKEIRAPVLSDSDSNDGDKFKKKFKEHQSKCEEMIVEECSEKSELFDFAEEVTKNNKKMIVEETLSQLPVVDLGEDFDWNEIVKKNEQSTSNVKSSENANNSKEISDMEWSKGQVPGLQGGVSIGIKNNANDNTSSIGKKEHEESGQSEMFDLLEDVEKVEDTEELVANDNVPVLEVNEFDWNMDLKKVKRKTPTKLKMIDKPCGAKQQKKLDPKLDQTQTKIPFAGDNACLSMMGPSAFAMFCATERSKIVKKHPELSPPEVAAYMNKLWKEILPEEREYYRDLANKHNESVSNKSLSQSSKISKTQLSQTEKEKNKKQLVSMLEKMKMNKAEVKNESMIMRTFVNWNINISQINEKFKKSKSEAETSAVIGSLNSLLWILRLNKELFTFDITELHAQLNVTGYDINQINMGYVKEIVDKWITEKKDMSVFHPLHSFKT